MNSMKLDQLDLKILNLLQDSEMLAPKLTRIAKALGSTNATVYRRIEVLKREGIIIGHTTKIDAKMIGKNVEAFLYLRIVKNLDKSEMEKLMKKVSDLDGIESVYIPMSNWNYVLKIRCADMIELDKFVQDELTKLPIEELQIELISKTIKEGYTSIGNVSKK